ncbi:helix-turn-helix domain-containing protein [Streptomyces decoyicus]|uniref:helix-turn-helix domain-containing protein n=1 Tax=Streptomyces decoyicus TaxID=249567 RepID=UPI0033AE7FFB
MSCPGPKIPPVALTDAERETARLWVRRRTSARGLALRSRIVLECADHHAIAEVARRLRITTDTVRTWRRRVQRRLEGLCDEPRPGVPRKIPALQAGGLSGGEARAPPRSARTKGPRPPAVAGAAPFGLCGEASGRQPVPEQSPPRRCVRGRAGPAPHHVPRHRRAGEPGAL